MKYMGSKNRIAKEILPIILKDRKEGQWYVEPFVGGANMIDKVDGNRVGSDLNEHLIEMWKSVAHGWMPPAIITEENYNYIKQNKDLDKTLTGYAGFALSFGGKWFGGYRRDVAGTQVDEALKQENENTQSRRSYDNMKVQQKDLSGVTFVNKSYSDLKLTKPCIIYCDPPYAGTTKYKDSFDHKVFWQWCREMTIAGHQVFISEYNAPDDFECVWSKEVTNSLSTKTTYKPTEKLFVFNLN